jgi:CRISPR-associated protein Cmr1
MRKQLPGLPPDVTPKQPTDVITQVREYELITPLFGGGVTTKKADPVTIIRATEIRGQLRFWWRACRGGQNKLEGSPIKMKKEEDIIWGAAYKKGKPTIPSEQTIQISAVVDPSKQVTEVKPFNIVPGEDGQNQSRPNWKSRIPTYAAFPLQLTQEELQQDKPQPNVVSDNVYFTLTISFHRNNKEDVEAALWAWETFGGLGARTRRGFGALRCISIKENEHPLAVDLPPGEQGTVQKWIQSRLKRYVVDGVWANTVPHLNRNGGAFKVISRENSSDPFASWNDLIDSLKNFRQTRYPSKNPKAKNPGQSLWSEPSAIRQRTGQSLPAHKNPIPDPLISKFPRAAFGLPIIFKFKDNKKYKLNDRDSDPRKTILQLKTSERFASPLILKPISCQRRIYVGLALILEGTRLDEDQLILKTQEGVPDEWDNLKSSFDQGEVLVIANQSPASQIQIDHNINALQAFLKYLQGVR